jgi:hypothetical protein
MKSEVFEGYAFPVISSDTNYVHDTGMTLRDWFAGQALASIKDEDFASAEGVADRAYEIADAMMQRRKVLI